MFLCLRLQQFTQVHFRVIRIWNKPLLDVAQIGVYFSWFAFLLVWGEKKMLSVLRATLLQCTFPCQKTHFLDCSKELLKDAVNQFSSLYATSASTPVSLLRGRLKSLCWRGSTMMQRGALKREKEGKRKKGKLMFFNISSKCPREWVCSYDNFLCKLAADSEANKPLSEHWNRNQYADIHRSIWSRSLPKGAVKSVLSAWTLCSHPGFSLSSL